MFKKNILFLLLVLCLLPFTSFAQQNNYTISGNIKGVGNDSVIIIINNYDADGKILNQDTLIAIAKEGQFYFKGKANSTKDGRAIVGGFKSRNSFSFYLEPGKIKIEGEKNALSDLLITGTKSNDEKIETTRYSNLIYQRVLLLREALKNQTKGTIAYNNIVKEIDVKFDSIQNYKFNYLKTHPNSFVSVTFLWVKQDNLPVDELEKFYNAFAPSLQTSSYGLDIRDKIKVRKFVAVGNPAPDFVSTDTSGKAVRLSDFKSKYVLLEFWANWCVPCREEHPNLVGLYNKYSPKGFTIMQYSMDDKTAQRKWKDAIIKDGLIWTEVSDLNGFESKVAKLYGVQPIPDNFLIGPDGKILARDLRGEALTKKLEEIFN